jgi:hypothetical protein
VRDVVASYFHHHHPSIRLKNAPCTVAATVVALGATGVKFVVPIVE